MFSRNRTCSYVGDLCVFQFSLYLTFLLPLSLLTISLLLKHTSLCSAYRVFLILLTHLLDHIILPSSVLPSPILFLHSLSTFCKEQVLGTSSKSMPWDFISQFFSLLRDKLSLISSCFARITRNTHVNPAPREHTAKQGQAAGKIWWGAGDWNDTLMAALGNFSLLPTGENMTQQLFHLNASSELTSCLHFLDTSLGFWLYHLSKFPH